MKVRRRVACLCLLLPILSGPAFAQKGNADHFERKVRPLLIAKCVSCHGETKQKGGLRLDTPQAFSKGGDSGPIVVAGQPQESLLIEAVRYSADLKMPPKGKLSDAEIADLTAWVKSGAEWPNSPSSNAKPQPKPASAAWHLTEADRGFWAFQPVGDPKPPAVKQNGWPQSPIDHFVLAGLTEHQLKPARPADKRNLIRRASIDLTGLPPTPEEVDAFLADTHPDAFARVVDRLLASPRYGEHWGRHWLDLARYADSNGMDENVAYANAWRYRDYVIRSLNADKPYDVFVKEQLAGDLLPASPVESVNHDRVTATGFLVVGPKMLAEDDPVKMEMDIIDEQVDTVGRVFLGFTLGCARCHDHKFDPVPTSDYYALAGIFKSTKSMQNHRVVAMWNERPLATEPERKALEAHRKQVADLTAEIKKLASEGRAQLRTEIRDRSHEYLAAALKISQIRGLHRSSLLEAAKGKTPENTQVREAEKFDAGNVLVDTSHYGVGIGIILNKGELPNFTEYAFEVPEPGLYGLELRYSAAEARPVRVQVNGALLLPEAAGKTTGSWTAESQKWQVEGQAWLPKGKAKIRLERDGPFPHFDKLALVRLKAGAEVKTAEVAAREQSLNLAWLKRWDDYLSKHPEFKPELGADAKSLKQTLAKAENAAPAEQEKAPLLRSLKKLWDDPASPLHLPKGPAAEPYFSADFTAKLKQKRQAQTDLEAKAPAVSEVMGVEDQKVVNLRVHIRGNHLTLGEEVPRRFLQVVSGETQPSLSNEHSGRLELAEWLTSPKNPLTARVMVNRIWQGHFGEGLVRSPDNFGKLGERPTHPALLDWLARRFMESGWSIKAMHRTIMLSSAYQMSTDFDEAAAQVDPENLWLWRMSRRRMEAESVRDALLHVSGLLDPHQGGSLLPTKNHAYVNNTGQRGSISYDSNRRSIYLPVVRSGVYEVFQAFDFADPSTSNGKRIPTTVAPQALFMLNDDVVMRSADALAARLLDRKDLDARGKVQIAYRVAYGREPSVEESKRSLTFLDRFEKFLSAKPDKLDPPQRTRRAWRTYCQAILASSEFLYID